MLPLRLAPTSLSPLGLKVERAEGSYIYTKDGKRYLDFISGIGVSNIGHSHPKVLQAIKEQSAKYLHTMVYGEFELSPQSLYAEAITSTLPASLDCVYFTNSGTEATEGAMKLAKRWSGRTEFASCIGAYHGSTQGALSLAGGRGLQDAFLPLLPGIAQLRYGKVEDLHLITERTAAFFVETVSAEAGTIIPPSGYLQDVRKRCNQTGTLMIIDAIQTGMGRTGQLWGFEDTGIVPDVLLVGKALGGGLPLGAFIASREMMLSLSNNPVLGHITTFGGHPLSCAAGLAAFEVVREESLAQRSTTIGALLESELLRNGDIPLHGKGLLRSIELRDFDHVLRSTQLCIDTGLITDWFLFNDKRIRLAPPLNTTEEQALEACGILAKAITA